MHPESTDRDPTAADTDPLAARIGAELRALIQAEIKAAGGRLPFDRFMELALYAPGLGYYAAGAAKLGPGGDFVTAPELSPLFGQCLANQCAEVLERLGGGDLIELGAGTGALAVQILEHLEQLGALPERYRILEPSPDLRERQRQRIMASVPHLSARCDWLERLPSAIQGLLIANEVLDAMPVHRFRVREDGGTDEIFVVADGEGLGEIGAPAQSRGLAAAVARLQAEGLALTPGYSSEINLRLGPWIEALATSLRAGLILLVDYGYPRAAYYQADRHMGTLMCHHRHRAHDDPYRSIGLQDITAHVDFSAVAEAARAAGLELHGFTTQAHFLIGCGIDALLASAADPFELAQGAKQLLLPSAMGERFKVIALGSGVAGPWRGFQVRDLGAWL